MDCQGVQTRRLGLGRLLALCAHGYQISSTLDRINSSRLLVLGQTQAPESCRTPLSGRCRYPFDVSHSSASISSRQPESSRFANDSSIKLDDCLGVGIE